MGVYDSSRTRVQPIFDALYKQNKTGTLWLRFKVSGDRLISCNKVEYRKISCH